MRGLDKIELLKTNRSTTGWAMKVGPGVTWDKVTIKALNTQILNIHLISKAFN